MSKRANPQVDPHPKRMRPSGSDAAGGGVVDEDAAARARWPRAPIPASFRADTEDLHVMAMESDYYSALPYGHVGNADKEAVVRLYGTTRDGHSVLAHVHGFRPYLYASLPPAFRESHCAAFVAALEARLRERVRSSLQVSRYIRQVEIVERMPLVGYQGDAQQRFLMITTQLPMHVPTCRSILAEGIPVGALGLRVFKTYESNFLYVLRFMVDRGMMGCSWVTLPAGTYKPRHPGACTSTAQLEVDVPYSKVIAHMPEGDWLDMAPLRVLSFDIECAGRAGHFPEAKHDPVIQIANYVIEYAGGKSTTVCKNVFVLGGCSSIVGAHVISCKTEHEMLRKWREFVQIIDPDIITGYNIVNFDIPYVLERAEALRISKFAYLGRLLNTPSVIRTKTFSSKAYGTRESKDINIDGRVQLDLLNVIQRDHKLHSYSLNSVSAHFLGDKKEDVHYSIISDLHNGTDDTRRRLAVYCLKDAHLPIRLLDKLMIVINYVEMARVTGVPLSFLFTRGQQIKVLSQLYRKANAKGYVVPYERTQGTDGVAYEGATVIDPIKGYYEIPVATLDFSSLYPSIMMAHNLCYSTLVFSQHMGTVPADKLKKTPHGDFFVTPDVRKGILPEILEELLSARKRAKKDMKAEKDPFKKQVYNGRQLALKISANSVYGFTGATVGQLPCLQISSSVTAYGREMIELTKRLVEEQYTIANGYEHDAVVVYGDTDSVMVKFGTDSLEESMRLGKEAAERVTGHFIRPINLEFEKVYWPYLLMNKKRYAGLFWTRPDKWDKMDCKGIETVRRDNCALVRDVVSTCLNKILIDRNVEGAQTYVKSVISDLLQNKIDMSYLVISKSLGKAEEDYAHKMPHVELAKRMRKRDPSTAPHMGDRVAYVIVQGAPNARAYEKAEDPIFTLENNLPIDAQYYLSNQLSKPLMRLFEGCMANPESLLKGEHTRRKVKLTPTTGGIMRFARKKLTCMSCRTGISKEEDPLCMNCRVHAPRLYAKQVEKVSALERDFARLWTQCQRCQGSLHQDVLCTSRDCEIFYRRTKVRKELKEAHTALVRYENNAW